VIIFSFCSCHFICREFCIHLNFFRNRIVDALEHKTEQQQKQLKTLEADKGLLECECERLKKERMVCVVQSCI
jgi:hypothetical protein